MLGAVMKIIGFMLDEFAGKVVIYHGDLKWLILIYAGFDMHMSLLLLICLLEKKTEN
jgi:hypothetical protein